MIALERGRAPLSARCNVHLCSVDVKVFIVLLSALIGHKAGGETDGGREGDVHVLPSVTLSPLYVV